MSGQSTLGDVLVDIQAGRSFQTTEALARIDELGVLKVSAVSWSAFKPDEAKAVVGYEPEAHHRVRRGDLLMSRANTKELVGAVVLVEKDYPLRLLSDKTLRLVVAPEKVDKSYLLFALRSDSARKHIEHFATGSSESMRNIAQSVITSIPLILPSSAEQRRIVARLSNQLTAVEEARHAAQAQLSEIRLLKAQALKAAFAAIEDSCPLGKVARIQSGYAFKSGTFQKLGVRLLRNANISPGRVYWDDTVSLSPDAATAHTAYALAEGDVLISLDRPIISSGIKVARVTATDLPALLVQRVGRFRIDETRLNADYLYAFLHTEPFIEAISGHEQSLGVPHISPGQIEAIKIPLPSLKEQQRLAVILNQIAEATREAEVAAEQQLKDIELLPSRLLAEVFGAASLTEDNGD